MTEAASTSETSVNFYQTTWRNIPEDSYLHTRRRENLKPAFLMFIITFIADMFQAERGWLHTTALSGAEGPAGAAH
jgi:hypothetical protein